MHRPHGEPAAPRRAHLPLFVLTWHHYAIILAGLGTCFVYAFLGGAFPWHWEDWYAEHVAMRKLEAAYHFTSGPVMVRRGDGRTYPLWGIVSLAPDSELASCGVNPGDAVFYGPAALADALTTAWRGRPATFEVIRTPTVGSEGVAVVEIRVPPRRR